MRCPSCGGHVSSAQASVRHLAKLITDVLPFGVGGLVALLNPRRQALHDLLARTAVVDA